jgi:hypothetical protein
VLVNKIDMSANAPQLNMTVAKTRTGFISISPFGKLP